MPDSILAIRIHAGFNASSFTAGLLALTEQTSGTAGAYLRSLQKVANQRDAELTSTLEAAVEALPADLAAELEHAEG